MWSSELRMACEIYAQCISLTAKNFRKPIQSNRERRGVLERGEEGWWNFQTLSWEGVGLSSGRWKIGSDHNNPCTPKPMEKRKNFGGAEGRKASGPMNKASTALIFTCIIIHGFSPSLPCRRCALLFYIKLRDFYLYKKATGFVEPVKF